MSEPEHRERKTRSGPSSGSFKVARVEVQLPEEREVVVVPATALVYSPYGDSVYVVAKNDTGVLVAQQRFVQVGPKRGDQISLL